MTDADIPANAGRYRPIEVIAPEGTVVNSKFPAAVAGGNVGTSQRMGDAGLGDADLEPEARLAVAPGLVVRGWMSHACALCAVVFNTVVLHVERTLNTPARGVVIDHCVNICDAWNPMRGCGDPNSLYKAVPCDKYAIVDRVYLM